MKKPQEIKVEVTYTPGYQRRFTEALLRQYDHHKKEEERMKLNDTTEHQGNTCVSSC